MPKPFKILSLINISKKCLQQMIPQAKTKNLTSEYITQNEQMQQHKFFNDYINSH